MSTHPRLAFALVLLSFFFINCSSAYAEPQLTGVVSDPDFDTVQKTITEKIKLLESRGGGTKPFLTRLDDINKLNESGSTADALKQIKSLSNSVDDQLKDLAALRAAPKKVVVPAAQRSNARSASGQALSSNNLSQMIMSYTQNNPASAQSLNYASFQGSANDYVTMVAKNVLSRELGGLRPPCEGPFRLERFRNLQRISEMKKQGQHGYENFLSYHNTTEEIALGAKSDGMRVAELSQRVRYLEQQLGLSPLQSSLSVNQF